MQYILDRREGDFAILEQSEEGKVQLVQVKARRVSSECVDGDVLCRKGTRWYKDEEATQKRRQEMRQKLNRLLAKSKNNPE